MRRVLIRFTHGLGDAVQLTIVLKHLARYRPDWEVDLVTQLGKDSLFRGLAKNVYIQDRFKPSHQYDAEFSLGWYENYNAYGDCPSTKVTNCLREVFAVEPDPELLRYTVDIGADADARATEFLQHIGCEPATPGKFRVVIAHYRGNTSAARKDLTTGDMLPILDLCHANGYRLVVLDWDDRTDPAITAHPSAYVCSHLSDPALWKGYGTGDGETIAALIERAAAFVGIDSGPGHVAGATTTPALIVWTKHHPVNFYDLCPNVVHLVPESHRTIPPAHHEHVWRYFQDNYVFHTYQHLAPDLARHVAAVLRVEPLKSNPMTRSHMLKARNFHVEYYEEHKRAGLDYLGHGEWQESYGRWLISSLNLKGKNILDVGCACGSIAEGLRKAGARPHGIDLNNHMIRLGRERFSQVPLYVCDAVNMHLFGARSFDLIHSNQVAEHWKPELLPFMLAEFRRVLRPGGLVFTVLDTQDLFDRQQRDGEAEDPTNGCIKPLAWWKEQFAAAGFLDLTDSQEAKALRDHPDSFFRRYDWDWMIHRKEEES